MATVTFAGVISAQATVGETITITITKPDTTTETLTATTLADGSYTVTTQYSIVGAYSAIAHIDADTQYLATDSPPASFTITLQSRNITLIVNVA